MDQELLDLYSDYLISSFRSTTATGLSGLLAGAVSHDQISRLLSSSVCSSADLWRLVKPLVRQVASPQGVLILDDSFEEKPYTDEKEIVAWHWDHSKNRAVKGINFISVLYQVPTPEIALPVAFELVRKTETRTDPNTGKTKRYSPVTKNQHARSMLQQCVRNGIPFRYVLGDSWYAAADNLKFIKHQLSHSAHSAHSYDFVMPLKSNRKVALSEKEQQSGQYVSVETLMKEQSVVGEVCSREDWLEGVDFPMLLVKQLFTNGDGSTGMVYLISSDTTLTYEAITSLYQRRWKIEEYHKSLQQNASLARSPTRVAHSHRDNTN